MPSLKLPHTVTILASLAVAAILSISSANKSTADNLSPPQIPGVAVAAGQIEDAIAELDELANDIMRRTGIPGMAVAVVHDGQVAYAKGFGVRKVGDSTAAVDADTVFQIASVSKSVSATVIAHQVGKGIVRWDTPLIRHLPGFQLRDPYVTRHVTIGDLFAHRSGLPDHAGDDLEDLGYDRAQILERLRLLPLSPFRISYTYTNFGLTAAAEAVAVASGKDWATLADETIYKPLGMMATSSRFADFANRPNRAAPHVKAGDRYVAKFQRQPDAQSPAGGVSSSVRDLARWMAMVMQSGAFEGRQIIPSDALLPAITAQMISGPSFAVDARPGLYGYGFNVGVTASGRMELSHSGAFALGAGTTFRMWPQAHVGIVVLTNAAPSGAPEALSMSFGDLVQFGTITRDWLDAFAVPFAKLSAPIGAWVGKSRPTSPSPAAIGSALTGTYTNAYYGDAEISEHDGKLTLTVGPARIALPLTHWDGNDFTIAPVSENELPGSISRVSFAVTSGSPAQALTIEYLDENGLGTFERK